MIFMCFLKLYNKITILNSYLYKHSSMAMILFSIKKEKKREEED